MRFPLKTSVLILGLMTAPAIAQVAPDDAAPVPAPQTAETVADAPDCPAPATRAEAATQPDPEEDATAAENSASTGWTGGTGGSHQGTNIQGAIASSPTWQPPTARGLDLAGMPEPVAEC